MYLTTPSLGSSKSCNPAFSDTSETDWENVTSENLWLTVRHSFGFCAPFLGHTQDRCQRSHQNRLSDVLGSLYTWSEELLRSVSVTTRSWRTLWDSLLMYRLGSFGRLFLYYYLLIIRYGPSNPTKQSVVIFYLCINLRVFITFYTLRSVL